MSRILHFTLGPVQSFVEQARRVRDLWAGSFLLSFLSAQAIKAVIDAGGRITFPVVQDASGAPSDPLLKAVMGQSAERPQIGTLPNRFRAEVPADFDGARCRDAVLKAWRGIAQQVWERYLAPAAELGRDTPAIYWRQVEHFWELSWVAGHSENPQQDGAWLDRRKNWRSYQLSIEGGDHCTLMGDWQELSGYLRSREADRQERFWQALRAQLGTLDLGEHERLCAIALIKRLYPKIAKDTIGWELAVANWPSTPYLAAVPWLKRVAGTPQAQAYLETIEHLQREGAELAWAFGEWNTRLSGLEQAGKLAKLDGNLFHKTALANPNASPGLDERQRAALLEGLKALNDIAGPASPFYALLLMDGDRLGALLQREGGQQQVSAALGRFAAQVEEVVSNASGKVVYAGGDDVMALLPLEGALAAAAELRQRYRAAFDELPEATISAAIVYAHYNLSLRAVLAEAHFQLDEVAKEQNGRDSLAVAVLTGSGRTVSWASSWEERTAAKLVPAIVEELAGEFEELFASKFFYNIRQRFGVLTEEGSNRLDAQLDAFKLLVAEYQKSREKQASLPEVEERIGKLLRVCRVRKGSQEDLQTLSVEGALLVRFLATKGKGVER